MLTGTTGPTTAPSDRWLCHSALRLMHTPIHTHRANRHIGRRSHAYTHSDKKPSEIPQPQWKDYKICIMHKSTAFTCWITIASPYKSYQRDRHSVTLVQTQTHGRVARRFCWLIVQLVIPRMLRAAAKTLDQSSRAQQNIHKRHAVSAPYTPPPLIWAISALWMSTCPNYYSCFHANYYKLFSRKSSQMITKETAYGSRSKDDRGLSSYGINQTRVIQKYFTFIWPPV